MIIARVNTRSGDLGGRRANSGGPRASSVKARRQMPFLHYSRVECAHHSDCDVPPTKESQWKRNNKDGAIGCSACHPSTHQPVLASLLRDRHHAIPHWVIVASHLNTQPGASSDLGLPWRLLLGLHHTCAPKHAKWWVRSKAVTTVPLIEEGNNEVTRHHLCDGLDRRRLAQERRGTQPVNTSVLRVNPPSSSSPGHRRHALPLRHRLRRPPPSTMHKLFPPHPRFHAHTFSCVSAHATTEHCKDCCKGGLIEEEKESIHNQCITEWSGDSRNVVVDDAGIRKDGTVGRPSGGSGCLHIDMKKGEQN
ncbi:hypothetical protein TcWFU_007138 [Taenia crassiceps]|uniref:Uncharacterized protein n=1 Tax=Taenia crassiceps TaxID=6207 RepID=A0ABR4QM36_9CEST